jgi:hypothetical protein
MTPTAQMNPKIVVTTVTRMEEITTVIAHQMPMVVTVMAMVTVRVMMMMN